MEAAIIKILLFFFLKYLLKVEKAINECQGSNHGDLYKKVKKFSRREEATFSRANY